MRRLVGLLVTIVAIAMLAGGGYLAWHAFSKRPGVVARIPTVAAPCPEQDDMAALEGYAPGAGGTEHLGQAGFGQYRSIVAGAVGATASPAAASQMRCRALEPQIEQAYGAIDRAAQALPTDGYDEAARGNELADDDSVFAFVRDQIRTEAYAGAMRGGVGTLMSRGGSPADKTLLLAELLSTKGVAVRFVHATLTDADAAQAIGAVLEAPSLKAAPKAANAPADAAQMVATAEGDARPLAQQIVGSLTAAGLTLPNSDAGLRARWSANVRDHWWLQAQEGGMWIDLDPTLPGAAPGSHLGPPPTDEPVTALPDTLFTTIDVRVLGDFSGPAGAVTQRFAERQVKAADAYANPIVIQIGDPDATIATLANSTSFVASITSAAGTTSGDPFQPDPPGGARLLRMRLEIEIDRPGYAPLVDRRTIVDRTAVGGAGVDTSWTPKRTAFALTTTYDGLALAGQLDPAFAAMHEVQAIDADHALLEYVINGQLDAIPPTADQTYPIEAMHYFALDGMVAHEVEAASANHTRFYFDRPEIAFVRHAFRANGSSVTERNEFDVVESAMDATGSDVATAMRDNVVRGVVDDAIEANVVLPKARLTTRSLFVAAARAGVPIVAVLPAASPPPLPPIALAAVTASLQRGALVVTARAVSADDGQHVGWWAVDPASGSTVGRLESGAGQALSEYLPTTGVALKANTIADVVGGFDACMFADVNAALANSGGNGMAMVSGCGGQVACNFAEGQAVGAFADFLYGNEVINQLTDLDNEIWALAEKMCGPVGSPLG